MENVKNKRVLREIAKRYVKGMLQQCEPQFAFMESGLSDEEVSVISEEINRIAKALTRLEAAYSANDLVNEYYQ